MKKRLLVVDDEPDITSGIKGCLGDEKFHVDIFNDPLEALSHFETDMYDFALIDVKMPKMNGFELYREMRKIDENINIYFITAFEIHSSEFSSIFPRMDVKGFLQKPFSPDSLIELLETRMQCYSC